MLTRNRIFGNASREDAREDRALPVVAPPVDIYENDKEVVLVAELAGVAKEGARLEIEGDELTLTGEQARENIPGDWTALYTERRPRRYERKFLLGAEVRKDSIRAEYEEGLLKITLAKAEKAQPKKIAIE